METINISEILRGTEVGNLQSVGYMQVLPLLSKIEDEKGDKFASPVQANILTSDYGKLGFENKTESLMIIPSHTGYMVKQFAQDHALCGAALVKPKSRKTIDTAACIQESQGGLIKEGSYEFLILPFSLREHALEVRKQKSYNKLWSYIGEFNNSVGLSGRGHLEDFLKHFEKQLNEFVAEFEIVPKQIGAIILINGEIVGIERSPSYEYWKQIWKAIIRECYGSLAILASKKAEGKLPAPKTRIPLNTKVKDIDELEIELDKTIQEEEEIVKKLVRDLLQDDFKRQVEQKMIGEKTKSEVVLETLKNKQFTGQIVKEDETIIYASMICTNKWIKNRKFLEAEEFTV